MKVVNGYYGIIADDKRKRYKQDKELRTQRLYIRVTEEEKEAIAKLAKLQHMDTSAFIRWVILGKYMNEFIK